VVVDGTQEASLATLPFAAKLEVVAHSPPVPVALVVTAGARIPPKTAEAIESALAGLAAERAGAAALEAIQLERFAPLDDKALDVARKAYTGASR